ncbi:30S ribosomal protein S3 [Candidatus Roizmanbacteria bacterium RIFCSPHIGHO2_01_FULL_39_12b]|uniref:Small ribosomal subunit protein uS3 n=1 Tax=Candidatus Roizmanbacteria bacterium RIFCSPHIGHO2_01_FULL_39_12b TaxID=1802030 RepID=A0A1F7GD14_9BACT|nr:MAG: 30S ribosomal protein S3 [Candidatus Roizmanbacteria bacterium RIFCSPHIGHO2_01_FULL_39_12b]OGK47102.1 MAG: 30S ribosomal protein S3 [Candidatus Roizmanbacteria bacterium RIFCSPLOWO2_01_FULL_39_19]
MGQKVHPKGLRLGITKMWDSRWLFSDKKMYRDSLIEDIKVRDGVMKKFGFAHVTQVEIERAINRITVIIHAVKPGMIIGRGGKGLEDVKKFILGVVGEMRADKDKIKTEFKIEPVKKPYLNAYYVASEVASKLVRNLPHRRVVHLSMNKVMESGAKGVKIQLAGRIAGTIIGRTEKYFEGSVPASTIREDVDFARVPALTRSGYVGVKVWIAR